MSTSAAYRKRGREVDSLRCVLLTALDVAEALRCMHAGNVLHGDLKPHNILLSPDDQVPPPLMPHGSVLCNMHAHTRTRCCQAM